MKRYRSILRLFSAIAGLAFLAVSLVGCDFDHFPSARVDVRAEPDDPLYLDGSQWYLSMINARNGWAFLEEPIRLRLTRPAPVAVIDTPVDLEHEDLRNVLTPSAAMFLTNVSETDKMPGEHGTHVAGLVGAQGANGIGIVGAAYNGFPVVSVPIIAVAGLTSNGGGSVVDVADAILYSAGLENSSGTVPDNPARVINMSLGASILLRWEEELLREVVGLAAAEDVLLIAASGNAENGGRPAVDYPARFPEVMAVGSVDADRTLSFFSHHGPDLDMVAPGGFKIDESGNVTGIMSTLPGNAYGSSWSGDNGVPAMGTSMAAPLVAGVAALIRSVNPSLSAPEVREILRETATDLGEPGRDDEYGHGLLNAQAALARAVSSDTGAILRGHSLPGGEPVASSFRGTERMEPPPWDPEGSRTIMIVVDPDLAAAADVYDPGGYLRDLFGFELRGGGSVLRGVVPPELDGETVMYSLYRMDWVRMAVQDRLLSWR